MFDFLNPIVNLFIQYEWLGFVGYIVLFYGILFWLGIELKSRGVFKYKLFRLIYVVAFGAIGCIAFVISLKIEEVTDNIVNSVIHSTALIICGILGNILSSIMEEVIFGIVGGMAFVIALGMGEITGDNMEKINHITALVMGIYAGAISGGNAELIIGDTLGGIVKSAVIGFVCGITFGMVFMAVKMISLIISLGMEEIITIIAKLKYKKALECLINGNKQLCLKYLNQSLYLLKRYKGKKYIDKKLANKSILLMNNLELIQKANNYYNLGNYKMTYSLYKEIMNKHPDLKEIIGEMYCMLKSEMGHHYDCDEIQKIDKLIKKQQNRKK
jgi:hypothetical protein